MAAVLLTGVAPNFVDPDDPAIPRGTTPQHLKLFERVLNAVRTGGAHGCHRFQHHA